MQLGVKTENETEEEDTETPGRSPQESQLEIRSLAALSPLARAGQAPGETWGLSFASRRACVVSLLSVCFSLPKPEPRGLAGGSVNAGTGGERG